MSISSWNFAKVKIFITSLRNSKPIGYLNGWLLRSSGKLSVLSATCIPITWFTVIWNWRISSLILPMIRTRSKSLIWDLLLIARRNRRFHSNVGRHSLCVQIWLGGTPIMARPLMCGHSESSSSSSSPAAFHSTANLRKTYIEKSNEVATNTPMRKMMRQIMGLLTLLEAFQAQWRT